MKRTALLVLVLTWYCYLAEGQELPLSQHAEAAPDLVQAVVDEAIIDGTFYTGTFNWYWQAGVLGQLSMRGYASTLNGGTITQVTACLFSESSFSRNFTATASVVQGFSTIQSITFSRSFPANQFTCHTLTGFNATVAPGEFAVVASYDKFQSDNLFAGLASTDSGQIFDVQIGTARPPFASGPQGPIQIRGVGIRYRIDENDQQPPPPPTCLRDAYTACLLDDRFAVTANWQTASNSGPAQVMYFGGQRAESSQSVFMWFFNGSNFEIGIKMVNACAPPFEHFWAFVSGLTNQAYTVRITDTQTGSTWTHSNPLDQFPLTRGDTAAFDCL